MRVQVKEGRMGFYNHARRKSEEIFELKSIDGIKRDGKKETPHTFTAEEQFSDKWMIALDPMKPVSSPKSKKNEARDPVAMSKLDPKQVLPAN